MKYLLFTCIGLLAIPAYAKPCNDASSLAFVVGKYTVIGREPESGETFTGTIEVTTLQNKIVQMVESVSQQPKRIWHGKFRAAAPGEGCVLTLENKKDSMACLVTSDLDNYARITCLWNGRKKTNKLIGLMALFPTSGGL